MGAPRTPRQNAILKASVYKILFEAAEKGLPCPTNAELRRRIEYPPGALRGLKMLADDGAITIQYLGNGRRRVYISELERSTESAKQGYSTPGRPVDRRTGKPATPPKELLDVAHSLRDPRTVVYNGGVVGYRVDLWMVNDVLLTTDELLELAHARHTERTTEGADHVR